MKIYLGESDSFLHDGEAEMVIIHVELDSGKKVQFPFVDKKPISEIYKAVAKITDEKIVVPSPSNASPEVRTGLSPAAVVPLASAAVPSADNGQIGREDLVRCIKVEPRAKDSPIDIVVGNIYRVLKVHGPILTIDGKPKKIIDGFDVIDDSSDTGLRHNNLYPHVLYGNIAQYDVALRAFVRHRPPRGYRDRCRREYIQAYAGR